MDAIPRLQDAASRLSGAAGVGANPQSGAATYRRNAAAEASSQADEETTVTLSPRAQVLASRPEPAKASSASGDPAQAERASAEQMSLLNAQLRRTYLGEQGSGAAG